MPQDAGAEEGVLVCSEAAMVEVDRLSESQVFDTVMRFFSL